MQWCRSFKCQKQKFLHQRGSFEFRSEVIHLFVDSNNSLKNSTFKCSSNHLPFKLDTHKHFFLCKLQFVFKRESFGWQMQGTCSYSERLNCLQQLQYLLLGDDNMSMLNFFGCVFNWKFDLNTRYHLCSTARPNQLRHIRTTVNSCEN